MRWLIPGLFLAGAVVTVRGDMFGPLNFAHDANLFRQEDEIDLDYELDGTEENCLSPFLAFEGRCLFYSTAHEEFCDWNSAQTACEAINGNLIEIAPEEQIPLAEYLVNKTGESNIYGAFWTGGKDDKNEDEWLWLNGDPVEGEFGGDESNNITGPGEDCLMLATKDAVYKDNRCENLWGYLCEPGPCYNTTCGINAHCDVVDYVTYKCTCDVGYEGDADTECTAIDPCDKHNCGEHARCISESWSSYHCECEEGYAGDPPNTACEYDPCYNIICGSHATCSQFNTTAAECHCDSGYGGDPIQGCSFIDPCKGVVCGEHARCHLSATTGSGECRCDDGYPNGDPLVKCSVGAKYASSLTLLVLCMTILFGQQTSS